MLRSIRIIRSDTGSGHCNSRINHVARVLAAYGSRCAICHLRYTRLLGVGRVMSCAGSRVANAAGDGCEDAVDEAARGCRRVEVGEFHGLVEDDRGGHL